MARILHIDTSGPASLVLLSLDGQVISHRLHPGARDGAAIINKLIANVLEEGGCGIQAIDAVAVCNGPGSYTGLRIALATAKGICYALDKPLILHSRLTLICLGAMAACPAAQSCMVLLPARAGEYFIAAPDVLLPQLMFTAEALTSIAAYTTDKTVIAGSVADDLADAVSHAGYRYPIDMPEIFTWALTAFEAYNSSQFASLNVAEPLYLKNVFFQTAKKTL